MYTKGEINALEKRYKATTLLLLKIGLDEIDEISNGLEIAASAFDSKSFNTAKKTLDLIDLITVNILEY